MQVHDQNFAMHLRVKVQCIAAHLENQQVLHTIMTSPLWMHTQSWPCGAFPQEENVPEQKARCVRPLHVGKQDILGEGQQKGPRQHTPQ